MEKIAGMFYSVTIQNDSRKGNEYMIPQANQIYRHFKGNLYKIITIAVHTETEEELVIYQALYGDYKIYARPLSMFMSEVDEAKYPNAAQKMRFEPIEQMVGTIVNAGSPDTQRKEEPAVTTDSESVSIDPLLEAYLDTDSYRERLNILHGLQHRITEHMLNTMAIVIDFELPEGDIQTKYNALNDCLLTKEKYECNRIF